MMKSLKIILITYFVVFLGFMLTPTRSDAILIASEDFEDGAAGWNDNFTSTSNPNFSQFLHGTAPSPPGGGWTDVERYKTYSLSGNQTQITVSFDFYEIDSWDSPANQPSTEDEFFVQFDDSTIHSFVFNGGVFDTPTIDTPTGTSLGTVVSGSVVNLTTTPLTNLGFAHFSDQKYRYTFVYNTNATEFELKFIGHLDSPTLTDESYGIDNIVISDNTPVPEPATLFLFGTGLAGLAGFRRKKFTK